MEISGEHRFTAPRQAVWDALLDPTAVRAALPGCDRLEATGPDAFDVAMSVGLADVRGSYRGNVTVRDRREPESYRLAIRGSGKPGDLEGEATIVLRDAGAVTVVTYSGEVSARGGLARVGGRLLSGAAKLLVGQFFKNMERQVAARVV